MQGRRNVPYSTVQYSTVVVRNGKGRASWDWHYWDWYAPTGMLTGVGPPLEPTARQAKPISPKQHQPSKRANTVLKSYCSTSAAKVATVSLSCHLNRPFSQAPVIRISRKVTQGSSAPQCGGPFWRWPSPRLPFVVLTSTSPNNGSSCNK